MKLKIITGLVALVFAYSCSSNQEKLNPEQAKKIAEEAYIYAYSMIDHYKMMFAQVLFLESGAYEAPFNVLKNKSIS